VGGFAIFAFLTTLTREIIKDIEDFEGDMAYGMNTVPVVTGILTARIISISLILITVGLLYAVWYLLLYDEITLIYISCTIVLPLLYVIYQLIISSGKRQLHRASKLMKIVMIAGILYSVVVKVILDLNLTLYDN
jgi:4-hydroxybenzoate polyprenyltransferase